MKALVGLDDYDELEEDQTTHVLAPPQAPLAHLITGGRPPTPKMPSQPEPVAPPSSSPPRVGPCADPDEDDEEDEEDPAPPAAMRTSVMDTGAAEIFATRGGTEWHRGHDASGQQHSHSLPSL